MVALMGPEQLKGVWRKIFNSGFFHESVIQSGSFQIFMKICGDI